MFFNSIKEINRLRKEINRLINTGMSNIYLNTQNFKLFFPQHMLSVLRLFSKILTTIKVTSFTMLLATLTYKNH